MKYLWNSKNNPVYFRHMASPSDALSQAYFFLAKHKFAFALLLHKRQYKISETIFVEFDPRGLDKLF
jgi:hypothetical protein